MKQVIINNRGKLIFENELIKENYADKVSLVTKFLDGNFMRAKLEKTNDKGVNTGIGVFVQLDSNHMPTKKSLKIQDLLDILETNFRDIISDDESKKKFLKQVAKDWYDNKITKNGSLSSYDF